MPKKCDERSQHQERDRVARTSVEWHQHGGHKKIGQVRALAPQRVRDEPERHVTEPLTDGKHDDPNRGPNYRQPRAPLLDGKLQIARDPCEEPHQANMVPAFMNVMRRAFRR